MADAAENEEKPESGGEEANEKGDTPEPPKKAEKKVRATNVTSLGNSRSAGCSGKFKFGGVSREMTLSRGQKLSEFAIFSLFYSGACEERPRTSEEGEVGPPTTVPASRCSGEQLSSRSRAA